MGIKNKKEEQEGVNIIAAGTVVQGNLFVSGDLTVNGEVQGNIECEGKALVGEGALVHGYIRAASAALYGQVRGDLVLLDALYLASTTKYSGNITASSLVIEPGAIFNGNCRMTTEEEQQDS